MKKTTSILTALLAIAFAGCHSVKTENDNEVTRIKTPVTITTFSNVPISETINLNATSAYLKKNIVKSNVTGYIAKVFVTVGDFVEAGKPLFTIKTKEAEALSGLNSKDSTFSFKGEIIVKASASGTVTETDRQQNDYVSDGDQLAVVADQSSFVFLLNLPFELNKYAGVGTSCTILLPDSSVLKGTVTSRLSAVEVVSQTQSYIVRPTTQGLLPENLLAVVQLNKSSKMNAQVIERTALLSDETLEHFWVMKLINDSTAIKIPVVKGLTTDGKIEIVSPVFESTDRIINSGNYGLPDTAFVTVLNQ